MAFLMLYWRWGVFIPQTKRLHFGNKTGSNRVSMVEQHRDAGGNLTRPDFEQVFLPHLDAAYNLARWLLRNDQDAEDAVQEAYMRAYKAFSRFRGGDGKAWFMTILRNVCYTMIKKLRSHETPELFDEEIHQPMGESEIQEAFRQKANAESLHGALDKLPDEFREVIVLHDLEGLAYKEIAAVVGIPIGTVMSRLARARGRLRAEIVASTARESSL
jgi:RNA polymerase sigma-70 factor (ECF subfamily)